MCSAKRCVLYNHSERRLTMAGEMMARSRRSRNWWDRVETWLFEINQIELPTLAQDEKLIRDAEVASQTLGYRSSWRRLVLSTQRLIFLPMASGVPVQIPRPIPQVEISLREISVVERSGGLQRFVGKCLGFPVFIITIKSGKCYQFKAKDAHDWVTDIEQLRRGEGVRGMRVSRCSGQ